MHLIINVFNDTPHWRRVVKIFYFHGGKRYFNFFFSEMKTWRRFHSKFLTRRTCVYLYLFFGADGTLHFTANQIPNDRQLSTLLISLSENVYKILKHTVHPSLPKNKTYKEKEEALRLRFQKRTSHFRKRILIYNL